MSMLPFTSMGSPRATTTRGENNAGPRVVDPNDKTNAGPAVDESNRDYNGEWTLTMSSNVYISNTWLVPGITGGYNARWCQRAL